LHFCVSLSYIIIRSKNTQEVRQPSLIYIYIYIYIYRYIYKTQDKKKKIVGDDTKEKLGASIATFLSKLNIKDGGLIPPNINDWPQSVLIIIMMIIIIIS
jgi:hypothetical protein